MENKATFKQVLAKRQERKFQVKGGRKEMNGSATNTNR